MGFTCKQRTPIIDMTPNATADMANAHCVLNKRLQTLCPTILVLFTIGLYSLSFYERKIVYIWQEDNFDVFCVFVSKATHNI